MSSTHEALPDRLPPGLNLVCGSGGVRAVLGSTGAILACHFAGIKNYRTSGGASGGSIPTVFLAAGVHPVQITHFAIEIDFRSLIELHGGIWDILSTYVLKDNLYRMFRPRYGLFSSEKMGKFIDTLVPTWPENYWTVAAAHDRQWLFTAQGIFEYNACGVGRKLTDTPPPVGLAVRASAAIPGVFDSVRIGERYLSDGALTIDGRTPVGVVKRHFRGEAPDVMAVDFGEEMGKGRLARFVYKVIWKVVCGGHCPVEHETPVDSAGTILVQPAVDSVRSLQFSPHTDEKWPAVMSGFATAVSALAKAGHLSGTKLAEAQLIITSFEEIRRSASTRGELTRKTEALLRKHDLY